MKLTSDSITDGRPIPGDYAFCVPDPEHHVRLGANRNPHLAWSELPAETRSLVLICHDPDVPSRGDDVNREGRRVPAELPRVDSTHWVLVDLKPERGGIAAGEFCSQVTVDKGEGEATPSPLPRGGRFPLLTSLPLSGTGRLRRESPVIGESSPCHDYAGRW